MRYTDCVRSNSLVRPTGVGEGGQEDKIANSKTVMWLSCCGKRDVQFRNGNALCTPLVVWWGFDPARPTLLKQNIEQLYRRVWRRGDTELETWSWGGNFTNNKRLRCEGQREGDREATQLPLSSVGHWCRSKFVAPSN